MEIQFSFVFQRHASRFRNSIAAVLMAGLSSAWAAEVRSTVAEVMIDKSYGNFAFIRLDTAPTSPIACSVNGYWHFTLPLATESDKRMFAMLVTARTSGAALNAVGSGSCSEFGAVESLRRIGM